MGLYDDLGVAPDATPAQLKSAYRKAAKTAHPDAGGSREAMDKIAHAYEVLSDPERRARYDATGAEDAPVDEAAVRRNRVMVMASEVLGSVVDQSPNVDNIDVKAHIQAQIGERERQLTNQRALTRKALDRANSMTKRFILKSGEENLVAGILRSKAEQLQLVVDQIDAGMALFAELRAFFEDYGYEVTPISMTTSGSSSSTQFNPGWVNIEFGA